MRRIAAVIAISIVAGAVLLVALVPPLPPTPTPAPEPSLLGQTLAPLTDDPDLVPAGQMPTYNNVFMVDKILTDRAYAVWKRHCPGLSKALPYISRIQVTDAAMVLNPDAKAHGWPIMLIIEIDFAKDERATAWRRDTLLDAPFFLLGSGRKPGIIPVGDGDRFCFGKVTPFISAPELSFLNRWPSDNQP